MANPIMPKSTGTMMTASCRDMEPRGLPLLLGYLLTTGSYKLRLVGGGGRRRRALALGGLGLRRRYRGEEGRRHVRQLGLLFGAERAHEMRSDHHQQLVIRFLRAAAAEQLSQNGDVAKTRHLIHGFDHLLVDQAGNRETLAILEQHFGLGAALRQRGDGEAL